jgi:hypothetical protein
VKETKANAMKVAVKRVIETGTPIPAPAVEKPPAKPSVLIVELIKGTKASDVKFDGRE